MGWEDDPVVGGAPESEAPPERAFPTPGETAMTAGRGALKAIPAMAYEAAKASYLAPFAVPREAYAAVTGQPSPSMQQLRGLAQGAQDIATPAYKAATGRTGEITPEEMERAANVGGGAVAGLAAPFVPKVARAAGPAVKGTASAVGKVGVTPANAAKVLKFAATEAAGAALGAPFGGATIARSLLSRGVMAALEHPKVSAILKDKLIRTAQAGNVKASAEVMAKAVEKAPELADVLGADDAMMARLEASAPKPNLRVPPEVEARAMAASRSRIEATRAKMDSTAGPADTRVLQVVGPNGDRVVLAVKPGAKGASQFNPNDPRAADLHELQAEKLTRRVGDDSWTKALEKMGFAPDEVVGFAHFGPNTQKLSPGMVYVAPSLRRQGIASALYDAAKAKTGLPLGEGVQRPTGKAFREAYDKPGRASTIPPPGKVKMATVYTKPKGPPLDKPLTTSERARAIREMQEKLMAEEGGDIFAAFGMQRP